MQTIWILFGLVVLITARGYGDDDDHHRHKDDDDYHRGDDDDRHGHSYKKDNDDKHHGDDDDKQKSGDDDDKHHGDDDDKHRSYGDKDDSHKHHGDNDDKHKSGDDDDKHHGDDDDKPVYKKDDSCDFSKRDHYRVPEKLVPKNSQLVLLAHGEGYRAFVWDAAGNRWLENGRQVKLNDPNTKECIGDISTDATTVSLDKTLQYQITYFPDGSFVIREGVHTNQTNPCDKHCAPWALYTTVEQSDDDGLLTGVTHIAVFNTRGGAPPTHNGKKDKEIHIDKESAYYAFYRGAVPEVKPLPKGDDDDKHHGDDDDRHHRYGDNYDRHHGDDDDRHHRYGDDDDRHHRYDY